MMAAQLKLVRRADGSATEEDIGSISLLDNTDGLDLDYMNGWTPAVASGMKPGPVIETMTLVSRGDDTDDLASNRQALDDKLKEIEWYWDDPTERYGIWLRAQLKNETYARQTLIRRANAQWGGDSVYGPFVEDAYTDRACTFGLERLPFWEDTGLTGHTSEITDPSFTGGTMDYGTVKGDVPARLYRLEVGDADTDIEEFWIGFRTARLGTIANLEPVWQCDDGTTVSADTSEETDYMETDFTASTDMETRFYVTMSDVTANYSDQRGQFIVLLRAQCSDGTTTTRVRLLDGYATGAMRTQSRVVVDSADWFLYPLGTVTIPPVKGDTASSLVLKSMRLQVEAERTAGTGSLRCDKFILIPYGEGAFYADNVSITDSGHDCDIYYTCRGVLSGHTHTADTIINAVNPCVHNVYGAAVPVGAGTLIFAAQSATAHVEASTAHVELYVYYRWRTLRGDDT